MSVGWLTSNGWLPGVLLLTNRILCMDVPSLVCPLAGMIDFLCLWSGVDFTFWYALWRPDDELSDSILALNGLTWFLNIMTWNSLFLQYSLIESRDLLSLVFKMFHWYYFNYYYYYYHYSLFTINSCPKDIHWVPSTQAYNCCFGDVLGNEDQVPALWDT